METVAHTVRRYRQNGGKTMAREPEGYREALALIQEIYPARIALTRAEAAKLLGCSERTVQRKTEIPCISMGQTVRYPIDQLARWMAKAAASGG